MNSLTKFEIFATENDNVTAAKQPIKLQCLAAFTAVKLDFKTAPELWKAVTYHSWWLSRDGTNQYFRLYEFSSRLSPFVFDKWFVVFHVRGTDEHLAPDESLSEQSVCEIIQQ